MSYKYRMWQIERKIATSQSGGRRLMLERRYIKKIRCKWLRKKPLYMEKLYKGWEY